ncbi:MAG TPA: UbiA family prenyltransferase, partial [Candidatus Kapabacteria bacterium]|nr:UbiA family prenyltransferase [Candidatus Kapabacteria bacterium]
MISAKPVLRLLRLKQWTKNIFVFAALVFSKQLFLPESVALSLRAFFAFSFTASFIYAMNDIADRDRDRLHPKKRLRPIASGEISLGAAYIIAFGLLTLVALFSIGLDRRFIACIVAYVLMN